MDLPHPQQYRDIQAWAEALVRTLSDQSIGGGTQVTTLSSVPVGGALLWFAEAVPPGYLNADGALYPEETYGALASHYGGRWNNEDDPPGFFRVPNLTDKMLRGISSSLYGGEDEIVLGLNNLPAVDLSVTDPGHDHGFSGTPHSHAITDPGHAHSSSGSPLVSGGSITVGSGSTSVSVGAAGAVTIGNSNTNVSVNNATADGTVAEGDTGVTVSLDGGGEAIPLPAWIGVRVIIKT